MSTSNTTPPPLQGPSAKEKKYDRQLRLWAANGQQALEEAHVLLLNSSSGVVGVETLKNLVLPSVGNFTIIDEKTVDEQDLGVNFFLEEDSLGKSRAVETTRLLRELNPDVNGIATAQSPELWLANSDISRYTLIIVIGPTLFPSVLHRAIEGAQKHGIPVMYIESLGFYSRFSIQLPDLFPIVETHPDPETTQDLRLVQPWPELTEYSKAKTGELDSMSDHDHGHVPYILILLHYLDQWKAEHGQYPAVYKEKTAFREKVREAARRNNPEGGEENFDEAVSAVLKSLNPPSIPSGLKEVFAEPECQHPTSASASFWVIGHALDAFVKEHGVLPLPGSIPDMKAQSSDYIELQKLYRSKAQADLAAVTIYVRKLEETLNRTAIDGKEIEAFCKGAAFVKIVRGRRIAVPVAQIDEGGELRVDWAGRESMVIRELGDPESLMATYIALAAVASGIDAQRFSNSPNGTAVTDPSANLAHFDAAADTDDDSIPAAIKRAADAMLADLAARGGAEFDADAARENVTKVLKETARSGPVELHNISALAGGIAAQEAIKIITRQYVPADNTVVFDGIASRTGTFRL